MIEDRRFSKRYNVNIDGVVIYDSKEYIVHIKNINRDGLFVEFETNFEDIVKDHDAKLVLSFVDNFDSYWKGLTKYTMVLTCHIVRRVVLHNKLQLGLMVSDELFQQYYDDIDTTNYVKFNGMYY